VTGLIPLSYDKSAVDIPFTSILGRHIDFLLLIFSFVFFFQTSFYGHKIGIRTAMLIFVSQFSSGLDSEIFLNFKYLAYKGNAESSSSLKNIENFENTS
jgi:hypothetical protein